MTEQHTVRQIICTQIDPLTHSNDEARLLAGLRRIEADQASHLGFIMIRRQDNPDALVVFADPQQPLTAIDEHPLIDALCEQDYLEATVIGDHDLAQQHSENLEILFA